MTTLGASPFILVKGDSIIAQIISVNAYGDSVQVVTGSGAVVRDVPDAPINLANDPTITTDKVLRFTWVDGTSDGGTPLIDYNVFYDQGTGSFTQLATGITNKFYETTLVVIAGSTYVFKVQARNSVGISAESATVSILAAKTPDAPLSLANVAA